jgi:hypothetical protein
VGRRWELIPSSTLGAVIGRWPRGGSGAYLLEGTRRQAEVRPESRAAFMRRLGFTDLVAANPLDHLGRAERVEVAAGAQPRQR